jgi:ACR3 family arsenite efflux pump ArsB
MEKNQITIYFISVLIGLLVAVSFEWAHSLEGLIDFSIAALLYVMFLQVPLVELRHALTNARFICALAVANFIAIPVLVFVLASVLLPDVPVLWLGVLMVLLTPCIDYVVAFTHIAQGDAKPLLAATPFLLLAQLLLLPVYLHIYLGPTAATLVQPEPFVRAFIWLIAVPLALAALTQFIAVRNKTTERIAALFGWLPVPMTALLLVVVVAAVTPRLSDELGDVARAVPVYLAFAVSAPLIGLSVSRLFKLEIGAARAVIFSTSTRNSLVVLPLAFAVPENGPVVAAIIVTQTLVELASEVVYVRWVPRLAPVPV